ncbi:right-handed parallel beta-helix repeat-containing protein [Streptomyces sp. NPDC101249]|uniref:right-handed parallel beta-helix repeat-containing protein n=1 Tax=Streptomyces sp. NPDC101249 TaxID=3366140 RepID=UPI003800CEE7
MPMYTFGGTPADVLTTTTGDVVPDWPVTVRVAGTGAVVSALFETDGTTPIAQLRSNPATSSQPGAIRTFKTDGVAEIEYEFLDKAGQPVRYYQAARELASGAEGAVRTTGATMSGKLQWGMTLPDDVVSASFVTGDPYDRYRRLASGEQQWGPGTGARDVRQFRSGPARMRQTGILAPDQLDLSAQGVFQVLGATGNGAADDRAVVQAALDAARDAGGGLVVLPPGRTYGVGTFLVVYDNTTIWAYGATIKAIGNSGLLRNFTASEAPTGYTGHGNIAVLGGVWNGNAYNGSTGSVTAETDVLNFIHGHDITVRDITVLDTSTAHALEFNSSVRCAAINCTFLGYRDNSSSGNRGFSEAIQIDIAKSGSSSIGAYDNTTARDVLIQGCHFGPSDRCGPFGRAVGSHTLAAGAVYDNIRVVDCRIDGTLQEGVYAYGWRRSVIRGNVITGTGLSGIYATLPDPASMATAPAGLLVCDNIIDGSGGDSAVRVLGYAAYPYPGVTVADNVLRNCTGNAVQVERCDAPQVTGNAVQNTTSTGLYAHYSDGVTFNGNSVRGAASNGINASGCASPVITGNLVDTTASNFGIFAGQGGDAATNSTDGVITGNKIRKAASSGIRLSTNATGFLVAGNQVRKDGGASTSALSMAASATGCMVVDNDFSGNGWSAATALSVSTAAPVTGPGGMQALPGSNLVDTDLNPLPALESAMRPAGRYETTSRLRLGTSSTPTSGMLYLVPIWLPKGQVVSSLSFVSGGTGATSPTNWWFTLHDSSKKALARTADQLTAAWGPNTVMTKAIAQTTAGTASSYTTTYAGLHYLGVMVKASTNPTLVSEGSMADVVAQVTPGFGGTDSGMSTPPTVSGSGFTAGAFGTGSGILAYGYTG